MPKITIDGKEFEFQNGQTIIQAARDAGVDIPHFCWHPKLSVSGNCRVCLVEVEKIPKLVIACSTMASDGMVVNTKSPKATEARNAVMEFILINHPLDCPICDEAGECKLQDYAFSHSKGESRFVEEKNHNKKRTQLGPRIMFDAERCISCSRCIRFSDEIAGENQLTFSKRGDKVTITTFPGEEFDNPYTLNTVDICPVGALTSKDFRFDSRIWEMSHTPSVCNGCSRGCNIDIWVRDNEIKRLTPRNNPEVNQEWMCDKGRLETFRFVNDDTRVEKVFVRREHKLYEIDWQEAFELALRRIKEYKTEEVAFLGSPFATVEDNYLFAKLANSMGIKNFSITDHTVAGDKDDLLIREDKSPNKTGAKLASKVLKSSIDFASVVDGIKSHKIRAVYMLEDDLAGFSDELKEMLGKLDLLIVHAHNFNETTELADIIFPVSTYAEKNGTFVNYQGRAQRLKPAVATLKVDRALDNLEMSRWDKFGTKYDRWAQGRKVDVEPTWKVLQEFSKVTGLNLHYNMAEDIFGEITKSVSEFANLDYDVIGENGAKLKGV